MAKIDLSLSKKNQKETGKAEVLIRFFNGKAFNLRCKSGVFVNLDFFEFYIDRVKTLQLGVRVPDNRVTATATEAEKNHYVLRETGEIVTSRRRVRTPEVIYHEDCKNRLDEIKEKIIISYNAANKDDVKDKWLYLIVDEYNHPEKYLKEAKPKPSFYALAEEYISESNFSYSHTKAFRVLVRDVARYEGFVRATEKDNRDFTFDIDKVTGDDIDFLFDYLRNEYDLSQEYPTLFKTLLKDYPSDVTKGQQKIEVRGHNTIVKLKKKLKAFFAWLNKKGKTSNDPWKGKEIGTEIYGNPYYITLEERNKIADADLSECLQKFRENNTDSWCFLPLKTLETQRDIFIFQCLIGCRVGDLEKLTVDKIHDGVLVYTPHKTKDGKKAVQATVPLLPRALELMERYKGVKGNYLMPCISAQKYNVAIKQIFTIVGIVRPVEVRNAKTGENEMRPINEVASSHLARRTFVGNVYLHAQDPNLIGKMSGHVEGSRAFSRYRNIENSTLMATLERAEGKG